MDEGITVTGTGQTAVTPDLLRARLRLQCAGADVSGALTALTSRTDALLAVVGRRGVNRESVGTTNLHIGPRWSESHKDRPDDYLATHVITVTLPESFAFGELLAELVDVAGDDLRIDAVEHTVGDVPHERREARQAAFADARDRAEQLADLAGRQLDEVAWVSEHRPESGSHVTLAAVVAASHSREPLDVQPGSAIVASDVSVCWSWG